MTSNRKIKPTPQNMREAVERLDTANLLLVDLLADDNARIPKEVGIMIFNLLREGIKNINQVAWAVELACDTLMTNGAGDIKVNPEELN